jgi:hypothetical protein
MDALHQNMDPYWEFNQPSSYFIIMPDDGPMRTETCSGKQQNSIWEILIDWKTISLLCWRVPYLIICLWHNTMNIVKMFHDSSQWLLSSKGTSSAMDLDMHTSETIHTHFTSTVLQSTVLLAWCTDRSVKLRAMKFIFKTIMAWPCCLQTFTAIATRIKVLMTVAMNHKVLWVVMPYSSERPFSS